MFGKNEHFVSLRRWALALSLVLGLIGAGCGMAAKARRAAPVALPPPGNTIVTNFIPPGQRFRGDGDADNPGDVDGNGDIDPEDEDSDYPIRASYRFPDADDKAAFAYGHRPSAAERSAIAGVVKRYFAYAAAGDGTGACSLLLASIAKSVPETYVQGAPTSDRTCAAVLSRTFKGARRELSEAITVVAVRVLGGSAQVVIASRKMRSASIVLTRQGGTWRVEQMLGRTLP